MESPLPAAPWRRVLAYLVDWLVLIMLFLATGIVLVSAGMVDKAPAWQLQESYALRELALAGVWGAAEVIYFWLFETRYGASAGKALLGLRVVAADGGAPSPKAIARRNLARILWHFPTAGLLVRLADLALVIFGTRQRLGDRWGETLVVNVPPGRS